MNIHISSLSTSECFATGPFIEALLEDWIRSHAYILS